MPESDSPPLVSILIAAYNRQDYLPATLTSCQAQTWSNIEVIVVDDGSRDDTASVAEAVAKSDARFRVIRSHNQGPGAARNLGLSHCRGHWVKLLDHDDLLTPDAIERLLLTAQRHHVPLSCGVSRGFWDQELDAIRAEVTHLREQSPHPGHETAVREFDLPHELSEAQNPTFNEILIEREWLNAVGGYDPRLLAGDEINLILRLAMARPHNCRCALLDSPPILLKRYHMDSLAVQSRSQKEISWIQRSLRYSAEYYLQLPRAERDAVSPAVCRYLFDRLYHGLSAAYRHDFLRDEAEASWEIWSCAGWPKPRIQPWYQQALHRFLTPRQVENVLRMLRRVRYGNANGPTA